MVCTTETRYLHTRTKRGWGCEKHSSGAALKIPLLISLNISTFEPSESKTICDQLNFLNLVSPSLLLHVKTLSAKSFANSFINPLQNLQNDFVPSVSNISCSSAKVLSSFRALIPTLPSSKPFYQSFLNLFWRWNHLRFSSIRGWWSAHGAL